MSRICLLSLAALLACARAYEDMPAAPQAEEPEMSASAGGTATLRCLFHGKPTPKITWRFRGHTIDGNADRYRLMADGALEINPLYRSDTGVYICVAENIFGVAMQNVYLVVIESKEIEPTTPSSTDSESTVETSTPSGVDSSTGSESTSEAAESSTTSRSDGTTESVSTISTESTTEGAESSSLGAKSSTPSETELTTAATESSSSASESTGAKSSTSSETESTAETTESGRTVSSESTAESRSSTEESSTVSGEITTGTGSTEESTSGSGSTPESTGSEESSIATYSTTEGITIEGSTEEPTMMTDDLTTLEGLGSFSIMDTTNSDYTTDADTSSSETSLTTDVPSSIAWKDEDTTTTIVRRPTLKNPVVWVATTPSDAHKLSGRGVVGGYDNDRSDLWVIRAWVAGELIPGKLALKRKEAYVPWNGKEKNVKSIEVLCSRPYFIQWQKCRDGKIPPNAVVGGITTGGEPLYVGRAKEDESLTPGMVHPSRNQSLFISFAGKEVRHKYYEILCTV